MCAKNNNLSRIDEKPVADKTASDRDHPVVYSSPSKTSPIRSPSQKITSDLQIKVANDKENVLSKNTEWTSPLAASFSSLNIEPSLSNTHLKFGSAHEKTPPRYKDKVTESSPRTQSSFSLASAGPKNSDQWENPVVKEVSNLVLSPPQDGAQDGEDKANDGLVKRLFQGKNYNPSSLLSRGKDQNRVDSAKPLNRNDRNRALGNLVDNLEGAPAEITIKRNVKKGVADTPISLLSLDNALDEKCCSESRSNLNDSKSVPGSRVLNLETAPTPVKSLPKQLIVSSVQESNMSSSLNGCADSTGDKVTSACGQQPAHPKPKALSPKLIETSAPPRRSSRGHKPTDRLQIKSWKYSNYNKKSESNKPGSVPEKVCNDDITNASENEEVIKDQIVTDVKAIYNKKSDPNKPVSVEGKVCNDDTINKSKNDHVIMEQVVTDVNSAKQHIDTRKSERSRKEVERYSVSWKKSGTARSKCCDSNENVTAKSVESKMDADLVEEIKTTDLLTTNHQNRSGDSKDLTEEVASSTVVSPTSMKLKRLVKNAVSKARAKTNAKAEKASTEVTISGQWTSGEIAKLRSAHAEVEPTSTAFWDQIALKVTGKSASECSEKWFSLVKSPKARCARKKTYRASLQTDDTEASIEDRPKSRSLVSTAMEQDEEDDIFNSTPLRGILTGMKRVVRSTVQSKANHNIKNKKGTFSLPCNFDSPIVGNSTVQDDRPAHTPQHDSSEVSPIDFRPGYKSYINDIMKGCRKAVVNDKSAKNSGIQRKHSTHKNISASAGQMNGVLAPDYTVKIQAPSESDDEEMIFFSDDEFSDIEDEIHRD